MEKIISWNDIPSLDGLQIDWEYKPKSSLGKRSYARLKSDDISGLFEIKELLVKVATFKKIYTGKLLDISEGGSLLSLPDSLEENIPLKVGFFLGKEKIVTKAVVRHSCKTREGYTTGIMFVDLNKASAEYIAGLYASKILYLAN